MALHFLKCLAPFYLFLRVLLVGHHRKINLKNKIPSVIITLSKALHHRLYLSSGLGFTSQRKALISIKPMASSSTLHNMPLHGAKILCRKMTCNYTTKYPPSV